MGLSRRFLTPDPLRDANVIYVWFEFGQQFATSPVPLDGAETFSRRESAPRVESGRLPEIGPLT